MAARISFTIVHYSPLGAVRGAAHMATQRPLLNGTPGLRFYKLLGSGAGIGFSARPDLRRWALLCSWTDEGAWEEFRERSRVMRQYRDRGEEVFSLLLEPMGGHGRWDGVEPWPLSAPSVPADEARAGSVAVLTRATIRPSRALAFWSQVAPVDRTLHGLPGLQLSFGVGEVPFFRQATLSVWESAAAMQRWAYGDGTHREVIRRTRAEGWYAEELFCRFRVVHAYGTLDGMEVLPAGIQMLPGE